MPRTEADVIAAKQRMNNYTMGGSISGLPPGYVEGFRPTISDEYRLTFGAGITTVRGYQVATKSHTIRKTEFEGPAKGGDAGLWYYVYLETTGEFHVDLTPPTYDDAYYYFSHPANGWRIIGRCFVSSNDDILFGSDDFTHTSTVVTVAPDGYVGGDYDYICDGTNDEDIINIAIEYVNSIGGGTVSLLVGTFKVETSPIVPLANTNLSGSGVGTIIEKNLNDYAIEVVGGAGTEVLNVTIGNMKVTRNSSDTNTTDLIYADYADNLAIRNITVSDSQRDCIYLQNCDDMVVDSVNIDTFYRYGFYINGTGANVSRVFISNSGVTSNVTSVGMSFYSNDGNVTNVVISDIASNGNATGFGTSSDRCNIANVTVKNVSTDDTLPATQYAYGFAVTATSSHTNLVNCIVDNVDNTSFAPFAIGIDIDGDYITVEECEVRNCGGTAFNVGATATGAMIIGNLSESNGTDFADAS